MASVVKTFGPFVCFQDNVTLELGILNGFNGITAKKQLALRCHQGLISAFGYHCSRGCRVHLIRPTWRPFESQAFICQLVFFWHPCGLNTYSTLICLNKI